MSGKHPCAGTLINPNQHPTNTYSGACTTLDLRAAPIITPFSPSHKLLSAVVAFYLKYANCLLLRSSTRTRLPSFGENIIKSISSISTPLFSRYCSFQPNLPNYLLSADRPPKCLSLESQYLPSGHSSSLREARWAKPICRAKLTGYSWSQAAQLASDLYSLAFSMAREARYTYSHGLRNVLKLPSRRLKLRTKGRESK